jgi:hypothetical protein
MDNKIELKTELKAFVFKHKDTAKTALKDHLVIASSQREACLFFEKNIEKFGANYLERDIMRAEFTRLMFLSSFEKEIKIDAEAKYDFNKYYATKIPAKQHYAKNEETIYQLKKIYKENNEEIFTFINIIESDDSEMLI